MIVGVVDDEVLVKPDLRAALAQNAGAEGVERPSPQVADDGFADQPRDALLHLGGGLVGESDGEDIVRADMALLN